MLNLKCLTCQGTANIRGTSRYGKDFSRRCPSCKGTGEINKPRAIRKLGQCQEIIATLAMDDESEFMNQCSRITGDIQSLIDQLKLAQPQAT